MCVTSPRNLNIDQRAGILTTVGSGMHFRLYMDRRDREGGWPNNALRRPLVMVPAQLWLLLFEEDISAL